MVRSPLGSIMMFEIGVTRPGICTMCLVSMPSCPSFSKIYLDDVSLASPIGPQIEARPPRRTIPIAPLSALPPQISSKWLALTLKPRSGSPSMRNVRSRTGMPIHRMRGGILGATSWKFMPGSVMPVPPSSGTAVPIQSRQTSDGSSLCHAPMLRRHAPNDRVNDGQWQTGAGLQGRRDASV